MNDKQTKIKLRRNARLLCPECQTVKPWIDVTETHAVLECGHHRTAALLSPAPGHLSIEAVMAGDPLALALFPPVDHDGFKARGRDLADVISDDVKMWAIRERWAEAA